MNFDVKNVTSAAEEQFGAKLLLSDKAVFTTALSTAAGAVSGVDIRYNSYDELMAEISRRSWVQLPYSRYGVAAGYM
jgi:hypothetical protein